MLTVPQPSLVRKNAPVESVPYLSSVIPKNRVDFLARKCRETLLRVPGNVLEVGVYRGGSLGRLAEVVMDVCPKYRVIGIDTFTGHPYSDDHPVHPVGKYADVDLEHLRRKISSQAWGCLVDLHQGRVEDLMRSLDVNNVSFAHIDCDLYVPIKYCALQVPRLMRRGGTIYFDDYGHEHCPGATRAVHEAFGEKRITEVLLSDDGTCWSCYLDPTALR